MTKINKDVVGFGRFEKLDPVQIRITNSKRVKNIAHKIPVFMNL